jgi:hypothetical protein
MLFQLCLLHACARARPCPRLAQTHRGISAHPRLDAGCKACISWEHVQQSAVALLERLYSYDTHLLQSAHTSAATATAAASGYRCCETFRCQRQSSMCAAPCMHGRLRTSCIKASDLRQVRQCARFSSVICEPAHEVAASALCKCTATCLESSAVDKCLSCGGQGPEVTGCAVNKGCAEDKGRAAPVMRWTSACMASMCAACSGAVSAARPPTCGR